MVSSCKSKWLLKSHRQANRGRCHSFSRMSSLSSTRLLSKSSSWSTLIRVTPQFSSKSAVSQQQGHGKRRRAIFTRMPHHNSASRTLACHHHPNTNRFSSLLSTISSFLHTLTSLLACLLKFRRRRKLRQRNEGKSMHTGLNWSSR